MKLGTLHYDKNKEEGTVKLDILPLDVVSLDILRDWIVELSTKYNAMLDEVFPEGTNEENDDEVQN